MHVSTGIKITDGYRLASCGSKNERAMRDRFVARHCYVPAEGTREERRLRAHPPHNRQKKPLILRLNRERCELLRGCSRYRGDYKPNSSTENDDVNVTDGARDFFETWAGMTPDEAVDRMVKSGGIEREIAENSVANYFKRERERNALVDRRSRNF
jgi:hypothetical protein